MYVRYVPLRCFGQHTNSTPENSDIPQGNNIAKLLRFIFLSLHVSAAVAFHLKRKIPGLCSQFLFLSANYELAFRRIALYIPVCKILFASSNRALSIGHVLRSIVRPWISMDFREFQGCKNLQNARARKCIKYRKQRRLLIIFDRRNEFCSLLGFIKT